MTLSAPPTFLLRLLEVGAVRPDNYRGCASWIDVTAIDLHSRHPSILEQDFLLMDLNEHREAWDVVSLSLVLNFVPDGKDRGTLLRPHHSTPSLIPLPSDVPGLLTNSNTDRWISYLPPGRMLFHAHSMLHEGGLCFLAVRLDRIEVSLTP